MNNNKKIGSLITHTFLKSTLYLVFFAAILNIQASAQNTPKSNLEVLEQDISGELERFLYYPSVNRSLPFIFRISSLKNNKEEKKFIQNLVKKTASSEKLNISFVTGDESATGDSAYNFCRIDVKKLGTVYTKLLKNKFLGEKTMERRITSELGIEISSNTGTMIVNDNINTSYTDEIPYDGYEKFESAEYGFTKSSPPDISFIESIIFPAAVITASAVAAILFFTIRSK